VRSGLATLASATLVAATMALVTPGSAMAGRSVPHGFFAMNWDQEVAFRSTYSTRIAQWAKIASAGVESVRVPFFWGNAQRVNDGSTDYSWTDEMVKLAADHGLELVPDVTQAPEWARKYPSKPYSPPSEDGAYTRYLVDLVDRYGPHGTFWTTNPTVPKLPINALQIWNEPAEYYQWSVPRNKDWAPPYGKLLRKSYRAIKQADPSVRVVLAGLANASPQYLEHLYEKGNIHGYFDVAAQHPYTAHKHGVLTLAKQFRAVMKKHGDNGKKLWITELGLPASKGKTSDKNDLQTTDQGMAKFLTSTYKDLMKNRRTLKVDHVFWYTWASVYAGFIFKWTGLYLYKRENGQDVFGEKPAYKAYVHVARSGEGCAKTSTGACAR
jgi:polysaccharide biosynthesis protein PslG